MAVYRPCTRLCTRPVHDRVYTTRPCTRAVSIAVNTTVYTAVYGPCTRAVCMCTPPVHGCGHGRVSGLYRPYTAMYGLYTGVSSTRVPVEYVYTAVYTAVHTGRIHVFTACVLCHADGP